MMNVACMAGLLVWRESVERPAGIDADRLTLEENSGQGHF